MAFWRDQSIDPLQQRDFSILFFKGSSQIVEPHEAKSVTMPSLDVSEGAYRLGNHVYKYPGQQTWNDVTITFVDTGDTIKKLWKALGSQGYNWSGSGAFEKGFFDTIVILQHGYDIKTIPFVDKSEPAEAGTIGAGLDAVGNAITSGLNALGFESPPKNPTPMVQDGTFVEGKNAWALRGAWIKSVNFGTHDYSSDELITMEMIIAYDHPEVSFNDGIKHPL